MSSIIHVNKPLTSRLIIELLDDNPDLEKIECPQSLYDRTSETYLDALYELGIEISIIEQRGRPKKYDDDLKNQINSMINEGLNPKAVANRLHIDIKTVYYLKEKRLKQGPKPKYSDEIKDEIIKLREDGVSVNNISSLLDIPTRTIYHILKTRKEE